MTTEATEPPARGEKSALDLVAGLQALVEVAIEEGAKAVERVHLRSAGRTFDVLAAIPVVDAPSAFVRDVHDGIVGASYRTTRAVNRLVGRVLRAAFDAASRAPREGRALEVASEEEAAR